MSVVGREPKQSEEAAWSSPRQSLLRRVAESGWRPRIYLNRTRMKRREARDEVGRLIADLSKLENQNAEAIPEIEAVRNRIREVNERYLNPPIPYEPEDVR
jgi:chromosome segregation ATPase